jgi:hypothetical protein
MIDIRDDRIGRRPALIKSLAAKDDVVVFPCAPVIVITVFSAIRSLKNSARFFTGILAVRAATISGLSGRIAEE